MNKKADYSQIAEVYDEARRDDLPHIVWWQAKIAQVAELGPGKRLLDLGCGTGRWTIPLAKRSGCEAVGVDNSQAMLDKARAKDTEGRVTWVLGDVERLELAAFVCQDGTSPPIASESFDCAFMSLMLHHLGDFPGAFQGVYRVLRPGGIFLIRQGTLGQILDDRVHRFFPETVTIDRRRTPLKSEVEFWLRKAGFDPVEAEELKQYTYSSDMRMLKEIELRVSSVLRLISDEDFEAGLARLKAHMKRPAGDTSLRYDLFTLFTARKPV